MAVVAVTGAAGFVGRRIVEDLARRGHVVIGVMRGPSPRLGPTTVRVVGDIGAPTDWARALEGVEVVVHCAARAHVMRERATDALPLYRAVNVEGTRRLADQAARLGVRRLVYFSSVKAAGERSAPGRPLATSVALVPEDAYGVSKREAELALLNGRGGIISSFFLLFGILCYKHPRAVKKFVLSVCLLVVFLFYKVSFEALIDYFSFVDAVSLAVDRSSQAEPRIIIWKEYVSNLKPYDYIVGVNIFDRPGQELLDVGFNFHNSFLNLHSRVGLYAFTTFVATLFALHRFYQSNKLYFILFSSLIIRCSTDGFLFFEAFDFIYFYFLLYAFASVYKERSRWRPVNFKL